MNHNSKIVKDSNGAATELGYIFTFLLGVLLLSMFSLWAWDIETATRERWNSQAIQANLDDIAAAIERADESSRMGDVQYSEAISWRATEADESLFTQKLTNSALSLEDSAGNLGTEVSISGAGNGQHSGTIELSGIETIWVVHSDGMTTINLQRPQ
jgi:hypothetical protein